MLWVRCGQGSASVCSEGQKIEMLSIGGPQHLSKENIIYVLTCFAILPERHYMPAYKSRLQ